MKYLTLLIIVLFTLNLNAQSLSEQTGETRSLYNAICIYNDITPGDIGMKEFRKLAAEYAKEVGCTDYELYLYNGGNNLYILYYDADEHKNEEEEPFWGEDADFTVTECCGGHDAVDRTLYIDTIVEFLPSEVDTITIEVVVNTVDTITLVKFDTVEVVESNDYCDCTDLDLDEAWVKYELLQDSYKSDVKNNNGGINSMCQVKLKKLMHELQRQNHLDKTNERLEQKFNSRDLATGKIVSNLSPKRVKKTKKRKSRRIGRGHARTANNSFWQKLFPFANC